MSSIFGGVQLAGGSAETTKNEKHIKQKKVQ